MAVQDAKHQAKLAEWREQVIACRSSGQSVQKWCHEQGISSKTYYNRERKVLQAEGTQIAVQEGAQFAALPVPVQQRERPTKTNLIRPAARIQAGAASVELYEGINTELAAAICREFINAE